MYRTAISIRTISPVRTKHPVGSYFPDRVLNGPENYNPTRPAPLVFKCQPDAARHTSMNCLPEPGPNPTPHAPALFSSYTCYLTQQHQICVCPFP